MGRPRNQLGQWCKTTFILSFFAVIKRLPLSTARKLGIFFGNLGYYVIPRVRKIGLKNLHLAYGDTLSLKEKKTILRKSIINMALIGVELPHQKVLGSDRRNELCSFKGGEHIDKHGHGVIIGAHISNWEWGFAIYCGEGYTAAGIARPLRDPRLNAAIDSFRMENGVEIIDKTGAATKSLQVLKNGTSLALLVDQSTRKNGVPTTFFGQPCWSTIGPAMLAIRAEVPIYPISIVRENNGSYALEILPPIMPERLGDIADDLVRITQQCQDVMEEVVRANPGQWMWVHDRWKKQRFLEEKWAKREQKKADCPSS